MEVLLLAILAMVGVGAAGVALAPSLLGGNVNRAEKRMKAMQGDIQANRREVDATRQRDTRRRQIQDALKQQNDTLGKARSVSLQDRIYQSGMKISAQAWVRNQIILGVVIAIVVLVLQVPWYFALVFGVAGGYLLPGFWMGQRRRRYQNAYLDELPNAVEAIVRGVKSGLPLNDSMRLVAKEAREPIKSEFQRVLDQQSLGKSTQEAVSVLFERMPLPEVNFFVVVITVQQQAGGNLSEALGNLARVLRNRKKMKQKIKAMSSEAKASAGIIGSLPFVVGLLVTITTPSYMEPLFTTPLGWLWLGIGAVLMSIGLWVMAKMVSFDI